MIVKSTQFSLWLQCILFDNKLSINLSIYLKVEKDIHLRDHKELRRKHGKFPAMISQYF